MPRTGTVVRCAKCGSTDAGEDPLRGAYELTTMVCSSCGHVTYADHYPIVFDWTSTSSSTTTRPSRRRRCPSADH